MRLILLLLLLIASPAAAQAPSAADYRADAMSIERLIAENYAYPERFPGGAIPTSPLLRAEAARVSDQASLLRYAEHALLALADHHAITGASFADSWAVVPSYADLWIERAPDGRFLVEAVRAGSPAERAGVRGGDLLEAVDGVPIAEAVAAFWRELGLAAEPWRAGFAARVLAAGRRNAPRRLTLRRSGRAIALELPSLYAVPRPDRPPVGATRSGHTLTIRFNDSLGDDATVAAFDAAMTGARRGDRIVVDLTDTPAGGNTVVARAVLGWFVARPAFYQVHNLPAEQRQTGIARQWVEQVLPRAGRRHRGAVTVLVGRWTGSMGEGLALGFDAIGADVRGSRMAGLLGAIYDYRLEHSGLVLKLPTERLSHVDGTPREAFVPLRPRR
ncbi:MAG TPA: PDZ domain-containing protein [Allosphingosinicella sp.]|jgi:carboxyl-terminal processing protease